MDYGGQRSREYSRGQLYLCANTEQFLWDHHKTHICAWPLKAFLGSWLCQNGSPQEMQQAQPPGYLQGSLRTTERIYLSGREMCGCVAGPSNSASGGRGVTKGAPSWGAEHSQKQGPWRGVLSSPACAVSWGDHPAIEAETRRRQQVLQGASDCSPVGVSAAQPVCEAPHWCGGGSFSFRMSNFVTHEDRSFLAWGTSKVSR